MAHFIANGTHLYKYKKPSTFHLLKTPLSVELTSDDMSYYVVAGYYSTQNLPDRGFIEQSTSANVMAMGYQALTNYNNPTDSRQIWRKTSVQVASAWYQGAYATSAPSMSGAYASCESCVWLQAVHFTVPRGGTITSASITATNVGCIVCNGSAGQGSASNAIWHPSNGWGWQLAGRSELGTPSQMLQTKQSTFDGSQDSGTPRSYYDLWKFSGTNRDGALPALASPVQHTITLNSTLLNALNANGGLWLTLMFNATINSSTSYLPYYVGNAGQWASSAAYLANKMTVTIE